MASTLDYLIIIFYFGIMIAAGYIGSRKAKTNEDYLVGGRSFPMWVYFPCLCTIIIGGGATFGGAKLGYTYGISGSWMVVMFGVGILGLGFLMTTKLSNLRILSLSEMLGLRYDVNTKLISAVISAIYTAMIAVNAIIAVGTVLSSLFGLPLVTSILIGGSIALLYTFAGGMCSLAITDVIQFVLMTVGVFFLLIPIGLGKIGGFSTLTNQLDPMYFNPIHIGWSNIFSFFLLFVLGLMIGQDIWQRVFTAKNKKIAKVGTITAGFYTMAWSVAMAMVGLLGLILVPGLENGQSVLPEVILNVMPAGLQGLVLAGILSALISSFTGTTLASSTLIVNDLIAPYKKDLTPKKHLFLSRVTTLIVGIIVLTLATLIQDVLTALDIAYALLSGSIFAPIMAGFFWKRANWQGAIASIISSSLVIISIILITGETTTTPIMFGVLTSTIVLIVVSLLTTPTPKDKMGE
ncbi:solute:Na+ symporter, SSS family [Desulfonispora thiosulfatigenes DSM 11270]|uniref:Solute:Na+ symporter, SSS family n=1 Tax=Desulfonispora thiosulfatigenes DSM 11270 TaxID=656914 RepID=A0A1W1VB38_DESTI|nr:sodium:solute symporter [Desulfonispora thiosulfatigenes]SMB90629.1 solute:Na+ symporter, SSS family [Desulfonispora thiosulfatigenes DSM 11270]